MAKESYWKIIKTATKDFLKTENSKEGRINFVFGLFAFVFAIVICVPSALEIVLSAFFPRFEGGMPWYAIVIIFFLVIFYFLKCAGKLMDIKKQDDYFKFVRGKSLDE